MAESHECIQEPVDPEEYNRNKPVLPDVIDDIMRRIKKAKEIYGGQTMLFRGQGNVAFDVEPSLFHQNMVDKESTLIRELVLQSPDDFAGQQQVLERMIKMQHYGLPTRLLDITLNPLVALYFACTDTYHKDKDGEVIIMLEYLEQPDSETVIWLCELSEYSGKSEQDFLEFLSKKNLIKGSDFLANRKLIEYYFSNRYLAVASPKNNERIKRQHGAFLIFGNDIEGQGNYYTKGKFRIKEALQKKQLEGNITESIIIPAVMKPQIVQELDYIGINKAFLFPELEHQAEYIRAKYK